MNLRPRISAPNIVAGAVLGLVLGGGAAYAANEFTGKNIKNGTLTGADIKNNSLGSADVKNGTLKSIDVRDSSLKSLDILNESLTGEDLLDGSVSGADITDGSLDGTDVGQLNGDADIIDNTITTFDIATDAIDSDEVLDFGLTNQDVGVLFAQIAADGTVSNSSGGVTAIKLGGTGAYEVDFGRTISSCAFTATIGAFDTGGASGQASVADRAGNVEAVFVDTNDTAGAAADRPFQLIVVC